MILLQVRKRNQRVRTNPGSISCRVCVGTVGQHDLAIHVEADPTLELLGLPELVEAEPRLLLLVELGDPARQLQQRREYDGCTPRLRSVRTKRQRYGQETTKWSLARSTVKFPDTGLQLPVRQRRGAVRVHCCSTRKRGIEQPAEINQPTKPKQPSRVVEETRPCRA
jgi:hypothetical protein